MASIEQKILTSPVDDSLFKPSCPNCYSQDFQLAATRIWQVSFLVPPTFYYADSGYLQVFYAAKVVSPRIRSIEMDEEGIHFDVTPKLFHCDCGNLFATTDAVMLRQLEPVKPPSDYRAYRPKGNKFLIATKRRMKKRH